MTEELLLHRFEERPMKRLSDQLAPFFASAFFHGWWIELGVQGAPGSRAFVSEMFLSRGVRGPDPVLGP